MPKKCFVPSSTQVTGILHFGTKDSGGIQLNRENQLTAMLRKLVATKGDPSFTLVVTFSAKKKERGLLFTTRMKPSQLLNSLPRYDLKTEIEKYSK